MYALIAACATPLLPGEAVLGVDVPAAFTYGDEGARLGEAVAWGDGVWLASAPGAGETWRGGSIVDGASVRVGFWGEGEVRVTAAGEIWLDGASQGVLRADDWAIGPDGVVAGGEGGLTWFGVLEIPVVGVRRVAWGRERILAVVCDPDCAGRAWTRDGAPLEMVLPAGAGGAIGEWEGIAWAGDPMDAEPDGAGRVCAEDGRCVDGEPGDHLGGALGGGYAVGTFNKWIVPARARMVPLQGGAVYALEEGAESRALALAGDDATLVIGAPWMAAHGAPSGAVVVVSR